MQSCGKEIALEKGNEEKTSHSKSTLPLDRQIKVKIKSGGLPIGLRSLQ